MESFLFVGGQYSWIVKTLLVRGDVNSWVTGLLHYNARQFSTLLDVHGDVNSWVTGLLHYNAGQFITLLNVHGDVNSWVNVTHVFLEH